MPYLETRSVRSNPTEAEKVHTWVGPHLTFLAKGQGAALPRRTPSPSHTQFPVPIQGFLMTAQINHSHPAHCHVRDIAHL